MMGFGDGVLRTYVEMYWLLSRSIVRRLWYGFEGVMTHQNPFFFSSPHDADDYRS